MLITKFKEFSRTIQGLKQQLSRCFESMDRKPNVLKTRHFLAIIIFFQVPLNTFFKLQHFSRSSRTCASPLFPKPLHREPKGKIVPQVHWTGRQPLAIRCLRPWPNYSIFHSTFYSTKNRGKNRAVSPPC